MNAKEARERALTINSDAAKNQLAAILKDIEETANNGGLSTNWYDSILPEVRTRLQKDGFIIGETSSFRNEYNTPINW